MTKTFLYVLENIMFLEIKHKKAVVADADHARVFASLFVKGQLCLARAACVCVCVCLRVVSVAPCAFLDC